jgi:hypothetical protein
MTSFRTHPELNSFLKEQAARLLRKFCWSCFASERALRKQKLLRLVRQFCEALAASGECFQHAAEDWF